MQLFFEDQTYNDSPLESEFPVEENFGNLDWLFSDVICYPERLLEWIRIWIDSGKVRNIICTIKMQGEIDWKLIEKFVAIPDSRIVHLNYNKHELTIIIAPPIPNFLQKIKKICIFKICVIMFKKRWLFLHFEEEADLWKNEKHSANPLT